LRQDKDAGDSGAHKGTMQESAAMVQYETLVDEVMRDWPATIRVFLDFRMRCVGCPIACFHTVDDACREHHVDRTAFLAALRVAAR
jgi:hybrid cluster-associated redox disulfide protein